ncbi:activating signal cointegrator 1-like [Coffea eugenioides]|uniref:activating signal cointegrator 1-like n=1 Tax=Coffea eugenioides TaxID=49369 RepID=UPI000F60BAF3|nr:activating signal cointegrator 1-like [Coffea eugenioides]
METAGQWLEKALLELCKKIETGLDLDAEIISGLVSYCEMAPPLDAKEYLDNIIGQEAGKNVIAEYLQRRGYSEPQNVNKPTQNTSTSNLQAYVKPRTNDGLVIGAKKPQKASKDVAASSNRKNRTSTGTSESQNVNKGTTGNSKKKKSGKVVSLAEASKGSIVYQKGKPCSCQARQHRLISNCLSCGKIVCEQEGEGPCNFCGALVLREGSSYAGLHEGVVPLSEAEAAAEAYAKRLVEYDRNAAARTTVIDDQSDYYEIEGNSWLSQEEKELLRKKREEIEEAERAQRNKVIMTFDLVGRKVLMNEDEASEELQNRLLLRPSEERESARIKPNPTLKIQPVFVDPGPRKSVKENLNKCLNNGFCLEISGRVQHDNNDSLGTFSNGQVLA